jgi:hypothetical protein
MDSKISEKINLNSPQEFKDQIRALIMSSNVNSIVAEKMKEAASK